MIINDLLKFWGSELNLTVIYCHNLTVIKRAVMQVKKAMINDRLHASNLS